METNNIDYVRLVKAAQLGDKQCLERLTKVAEQRLRVDVYRLTLQHDLTQDIVQEAMLEMFKVLGELKEADRFWPWLYKIALNKVRLHHRTKRRRKTVPMSAVPGAEAHKDGQEVMSNIVSEELKQIVLKAMRQLKPQHRAILTMRCYREMEYSVIAETMGCSEFAARMLFYRAKKSLQKQLSRQGFGRGSLLTALILFGRMTSPGEAAAAKLTVTAATTKVGVAASLFGMAASKTAVLSLTAAGVVAVGSLVVTSKPDRTGADSWEKPAGSAHVAGQLSRANTGPEEYWYYFPEGTNGPVMIRLTKADADSKQSYCRWRQNERGNYFFDRSTNTVQINNYRMWRSDFSVWRLPTDQPELTKAISKIEGEDHVMEYIRGEGDGLLVIVKDDENGGSPRIVRHHNILDEEYFRYHWPGGAKVVDNRDAMHKRGWTYFRITGQVNGQEVSGTGRMPFVYATGKRYKPWLRLKVGEQVRIADGGTEAYVYNASGEQVAGFAGGSFFAGLARPWMGLHTIDIVRRDAAESQVWFKTNFTKDRGKAEIVLTPEEGRIIYTIDMEADTVEKIELLTNSGSEGELRFSYLQEVENLPTEFAPPRTRSHRATQRRGPGVLWLLLLVNGEQSFL